MTSARACFNGFPTSIASIRARSSTRSRTRSRNFSKIRPRMAAGVRPHSPSKAARAASSAASISSASPRAISPICSPVDGFIKGNTRPPAGATHSPLIKHFDGSNQRFKSLMISPQMRARPRLMAALRVCLGFPVQRTKAQTFAGAEASAPANNDIKDRPITFAESSISSTPTYSSGLCARSSIPGP